MKSLSLKIKELECEVARDKDFLKCQQDILHEQIKQPTLLIPATIAGVCVGFAYGYIFMNTRATPTSDKSEKPVGIIKNIYNHCRSLIPLLTLLR